MGLSLLEACWALGQGGGAHSGYLNTTVCLPTMWAWVPSRGAHSPDFPRMRVPGGSDTGDFETALAEAHEPCGPS